MERSLEFQEIQMKNNLRGAEETLSLQKQNLELANSIYENAIIKKKIGKGNGVTVTQKHGQLILAEAKYIGSMMETFNARLALDKMYNNILTNQITR
jgi:outer membrane protein TolC